MTSVDAAVVASALMSPHLGGALNVTAHDQPAYRHEVHTRVEQLWALVGLGNVSMQNVVAQLAHGLEVAGVLGHEFVELLLLQLVGDDELLAECCQVDAPAKEDRGEAEEV